MHVELNANTQNWLGVPARRCANLDDALSIIEETVIFELKHFKILRMDDHISELDKTKIKSGFPLLNIEELSSIVIDRIYQRIDFNQAAVVQLTLISAKTINYCASRSCLDKLFILPTTQRNCFASAIKGATRENDLDALKVDIEDTKLLTFKKYYQNICVIAKEMISLVSQSLPGVDEKGSKTMIENIEYLKSIMINYQKLGKPFNEQHEAQLDIESLNNIIVQLDQAITKCKDKNPIEHQLISKPGDNCSAM